MLDRIMENYPDYKFVLVDGFRDCVIGLDDVSMRLIYSIKLCAEKEWPYVKDHSYEFARDFFRHHCTPSNADVGKGEAPIYCEDDFPAVKGDNSMLNRIMKSYPDGQFLIADGFDDAIIGVDDVSLRLIYSVDRSIKILQADMTEEDAAEHFWYNVAGSYVGEKTPIWCVDDL